MTANPYGLEPLRLRYLRRRKLLVLLLAAAAVAGWLLLLGATVEETTDISIFGREGSRVEIDLPPPQPTEQKPVRLAVEPGRVSRAPDPVDLTQAPDRRDPEFLPPGGPMINPLFLLLNVALPAALIAYLARRALVKGVAPAAELNFGIYKGAHPYEMHASDRRVFTEKGAERALYAKRVEAFKVAGLRHAR